MSTYTQRVQHAAYAQRATQKNHEICNTEAKKEHTCSLQRTCTTQRVQQTRSTCNTQHTCMQHNGQHDGNMQHALQCDAMRRMQVGVHGRLWSTARARNRFFRSMPTANAEGARTGSPRVGHGGLLDEGRGLVRRLRPSATSPLGVRRRKLRDVKKQKALGLMPDGSRHDMHLFKSKVMDHHVSVGFGRLANTAARRGPRPKPSENINNGPELF